MSSETVQAVLYSNLTKKEREGLDFLKKVIFYHRAENIRFFWTKTEF